MRLSRASRFLAVCGLALLVTVPAAVQAQSPSSREPRPTATSAATTAAPTQHPTQNPRPTSAAPVVPTAAPTQPSRPVAATSSNIRSSSAAAAPTATGVPPPTDGSCINSSQCTALSGTICGYASANATLGSCIPGNAVCPMSPVTTCTTHADCPTEFSFCTENGGQMVCTGLGRPGTATECKPKDAGIATTLKYAGIAVGCVAALGIVFAGVRWQKRRQRSKGIPADMFGEVDYGMTDRAPSKAAEQNYPFSSRPNAHGSDVAPTPPGFDNGYDSNQYYEEPIGYNNHHNNNGYGHDQYDNGQYYGNQKDGYGYDQQQQHHGGGGDGFYNNAGYDDYQQHPQGIASPAAAARVASPRQNFDQYGAEPSELDFGGHHGGSAHGGGGGGHAGGGYGRY
ncbi:hypothetical protein KVV02_005866 [Mortierella alpina]|uniref:Uncharacterized protein n=1 Tax=Mortierella alpina TaxID=64518 RepID=A0A9P7ZW04_MORAP|nr:hypothetical protein KVV02_005866 [Mortierella alpina]